MWLWSRKKNWKVRWYDSEDKFASDRDRLEAEGWVVTYRIPPAELGGGSGDRAILRLTEAPSPGAALAGIVGMGIGKSLEDVPGLGAPRTRIEVQYERPAQSL